MSFLTSLIASGSASRYLSAASVAMALWDHCITFDEEYRAVWSNPRERIRWKAAYLTCRYVSDAILMFTAYILSGSAELNMMICRGWVWSFVWLGSCFIGFTQILVGHRIHTLWEHRQSIKRIVFGVFLVFAIGSAVLAALAGVELQSGIMYLESVHSCIFYKKSQFASWCMGLMVAFDLFLVLMTIANALDMPRNKNIEIFARLNRDGGRLFLGLFVALFIALCLMIWGNFITSYLPLPPTWALSSIITSRLFCRVTISKKKNEREMRMASHYASESRKERRFLLKIFSV